MEKNVQEILNLPKLSEIKEKKEILNSILLPEKPMTWNQAAKLYNKINSLKRETESSIICSTCHIFKSRGSDKKHKCEKINHNFKKCPTCHLIGKIEAF